MSIPPIQTPSVNTPAAPKESGRSHTETERFAEALQSALPPGKSSESLALQAQMIAHAAKMQMLSASLNWGEGSDENAVLPSQQHINALLARYGAASRNVDTSAPEVTRKASFSVASPPKDSLDGIVARAAERYNLAPELVRAVIRAESSFNPVAVSPAGAQGLMQLMPGTARDMGVSDPFDPEQNVFGGTRYLRMMLDRYDGDLDKALAAYNWGPGNLDRSDGTFLPTETRNYIARIKGFLGQG